MAESSDSEYIPDADSLSSLSCSLASSISNGSRRSRRTSSANDIPIELLEEFESELAEMTLAVYEYAEDYFKNNILQLSNPKFYSIMNDEIVELIFEDYVGVQEMHLNADDALDYESLHQEIEEFVENVVENYIEFSTFPKRSMMLSETHLRKRSGEISETMANLFTINERLPKQRTKEWYEARHKCLSASNLWKALGSDAQRNSLIFEKCKPLDTTNRDNEYVNTTSPMHWGVKYEPVTVMLYENMFQTKIADFGCIPHPQYSFIGASPDGINCDPNNPLRYGRMLEIKNIVNRDISGVPKEEYWVQTQIQMETCDLDECDFVETRFLEYPSEDMFYEDMESNASKQRGVILHFIQRNMRENSMPKYCYMPLTIDMEISAIDNWIAEQKQEQRGEGFVLFHTIYWHLDEFSCVLIPRNRQWFLAAIPKIEEVWNTIVKERVDGYEHRASKKRISSPPANSLCLIRLDEQGNAL